VGSARRSAARTAWGARSGPHLGSPGRAASAARSWRPHLGRARPRGRSWPARRTGLAPDRRPGASLGRAAAACGARRAVVAYAIFTGLGGARPRRARARLGSSGRARGGLGRTPGSARRTTGRTLASRHSRGARLGHAGTRVSNRHAVGSVLEPSGGSRRRSAGVGAGLERLGSPGRGRPVRTADRRSIVGRAGGLVAVEFPGAGLERTGGSVMGCPQDRGARSSSGPVVVRPCRRGRACRGACAGTRMGPARNGGMVRP